MRPMRLSKAIVVGVSAVLCAGMLPLAVGLAATPPTRPDGPLGIAAAGDTDLVLQNMDTALSAQAVVDFYPQSGGANTSIVLPPMSPGGAFFMPLAQQSSLANGAYSAMVSADRDIDGVTLLRWPTTGAVAALGRADAGGDIIVAVYKGQAQRSSLVTAENTDVSLSTDVQVSVYASGATTAATTFPVSIGPGASATLDLAGGMEFQSLPDGFIGWMRLTAATPIAVTALVDYQASMVGVYGVEGWPAGSAAARLLAPLVLADATLDPDDPGSAVESTSIVVVNPESQPVSVLVKYQGSAGSCAGASYEHGPYQMAAGEVAVFAQSPTAAAGPAGASPLPSGCRAAAAIEATGGNVLATVEIEAAAGSVLTAAYSAIGAADTGTDVAVPRIRRAGDGLTTAVEILNTGTAPANVTIDLRDAADQPIAGCGADCSAVVPVGESYLWWAGRVAVLADGSVGSGWISSDQPIAAVVIDNPVGSSTDLSAYIAPVAGGGSPLYLAPLAMVGGGSTPPPTPTLAMPTDTPVSPPTDTPVSPPTATPLSPPTATPIAPQPTVTPIVPPPTATPIVPPPTATSPAAAPTAVPTHTAGQPYVDGSIAGKVPQSVLDAAVANPASVYGWGMPRNPNIPYHPIYNPYRECLTLQNPELPYHPVYNDLVFRAGCR